MKFLNAVDLTDIAPKNLVMPVTTVTATTYTAAATDCLILADTHTAGAAITVTLPTAVGIKGYIYTIKNTGATAPFMVTIATTSSQTIDTSSTYIIPPFYGAFVTVISDGSNWQVIDYSGPVVYSGACSSNMTPGTTEADVTGASISVIVPRFGAIVVIHGTFDASLTAAITNALSCLLSWNGSTQAGPAVMLGEGTSTAIRQSISQTWVVTGAAVGTYTAKLRASTSAAPTAATIRATNTTIVAKVF